MALMRSLNEEYESKKIISTFIDYDDEYQLQLADRRITALANQINFTDKRILEIGCGGGYVSYQLAKKYGCSVIGIDIYDSPVWERLTHSSLQYHNMDLSQDCQFLNDEFDVVISYVAWEHMKHPFNALKQTARILKASGVIYIAANLYRSAISSHLYRQIFSHFLIFYLKMRL